MRPHRPWLVWALLLAALIACLPREARAGDPYLRWYTVETPHFRVHFHGGLEDAAQRTANLAEDAHARMVPQLGWKPPEVIHIVLTDTSDSANGSAQVLPRNVIRMYMAAPGDMHVLGDYDDWLLHLLTHEHVHILHLDNVTGLPALYNALFGKTLAPNQAQPKWIIEGLAVALESEHTGGGRIRSTQFDMYLRADVLENNIATLDQISNDSRRWPSGNLWYLYGGRFVAWIASVYGPDVFAAVARDYGANPIAWGMNRSIRRATGRTYVDLYRGWQHHLRRQYAKQVAEVHRRGLREGTRLTWNGRTASSPVYVPPCAREGTGDEIVYHRADGDSTGGFYRLKLSSPTRVGGEAELWARASAERATFDGDCGLVFAEPLPSGRLYDFMDLVRLPHGKRSPDGVEKWRQRLTYSRRARAPDVSPDGRHIVYVTNHAGTSTLRIAELTAEHRVVRERRLVPSARYEQAFTPRFSPDGQQVAYGTWTRGGYRDIRIVDVATGRFIELSHDRAIDQQPSWTRDGRYLLFTSDRTGIANVYAYDLKSRALFQVTNVETGAYMPEASPDGKTLIYVGYRSTGFDLYSMPLDRSRWLPALPAPDNRPDPPPEHPARVWPVREYNPWTTLAPQAYTLEYGEGAFGQAVKITTSGSDVVGYHSMSASMTVEAERGEPAMALSYAYRRLPFSTRVRLSRRAVPRRNFRYGDEHPLITERITGLTTGVSIPIPGAYDSQSVALSYLAAHFDSELPLASDVDPYSLLPEEPHRGFLGSLHAGYSYSRTERTTYGISTEKGVRLSVGADYAGPELGSEWTLTAFSGRLAGFVRMPWADHQVLALAASGGVSSGTYSRQGLYYTGGFVDSPPWDVFVNGVSQSGFVLRGYDPAQFIGSEYGLLNAEYRFPLAYVDRGIETMPVFLRGISGAVFADYGGAFNEVDLNDPWSSYHLGLGAELWVSILIGYYAGANLRFGYARGMDSEAPDNGHFYFAASSAF